MINLFPFILYTNFHLLKLFLEALMMIALRKFRDILLIWFIVIFRTHSNLYVVLFDRTSWNRIECDLANTADGRLWSIYSLSRHDSTLFSEVWFAGFKVFGTKLKSLSPNFRNCTLQTIFYIVILNLLTCLSPYSRSSQVQWS
jgi:hypothetical protein